jgi:hypothetical protein
MGGRIQWNMHLNCTMPVGPVPDAAATMPVRTVLLQTATVLTEAVILVVVMVAAA